MLNYWLFSSRSTSLSELVPQGARQVHVNSFYTHLKSEPGRLSAKARRAKHRNSLFKMQSLQEYKNTYHNLQYSPKIMHTQELLFVSGRRSSSCGWLRVAWAWDLETARFSLRLHDKKHKNFFAVGCSNRKNFFAVLCGDTLKGTRQGTCKWKTQSEAKDRIKSQLKI